MHLGEQPSRLLPKCHPIAFIATAFVLEVLSTVTALRMLMLEVPSPAVNGESVELRCSFDLENDNLYSIKWYKNNTEFYRYVPKDWPPGQYLPIPGVRVDLAKSTQRSVYLKNVDLQTAGFYKCEISAESPSFKTVKEVKQMQVLVLPTEGPKITGGLPRYHVGDTVSLNCTSAMSKPAAVLRWYINEELVGTTDYETEYSTTLHSNGLETSILLLRFVVKESHFRDGNMRLRCTATIAKMYKMSNEELFHGSRQQNSGLHISENVSPVRSSASTFPSPVRWIIFILAIVRLLRMLAKDGGDTTTISRSLSRVALIDHPTTAMIRWKAISNSPC